MMEEKLNAPFPYFGGKSKVANIVWNALGQVRHYIEPFFGSGAILLLRPDYDQNKYIETICDKDGFIANVWRSIKFSPEKTAEYCDWPVNHADLSARRITLIKNEERLLSNLIADENWHDPILAGYWIWAASCWIGSGLTQINAIPNIGATGKGVHKLSQIPHIGTTGKGVGARNKNIYDWFEKLSNRLRYVRVVCGDWSRVCGGNWQDNMGGVGIFFDPPYGVKANRLSKIYNVDSLTVADDVRKWAIKRANKKKYKIIIAGYFDEHKELFDLGWKYYAWKTQGGYANIGKRNTRGKENCKKETLFFSPNCNCMEDDADQNELVLK
jgi:DNA adenine methylase